MMEHLVRILNDDDRQTLAWLRRHVGDDRITDAANRLAARREPSGGVQAKPYLSAVCRYLGVLPPAPRRITPTGASHEVGDRHLAAIRTLLAPHAAAPRHALR
jgi:hypothetical protein